MGRHGKKIFHLLPFHGEGEPDGDGFHKGEARHVRDGVLGFFDKMVVNDGFQSKQMVFRRQNLKKVSLRPQNTLEFLRYGQGKQTGEQTA